MAYRGYGSIVGKDQKQFKGESKREGRKDKHFEVLDHEWESTAAADADSAAPKGNVKVGIYYFVKEKGPSSPQIAQAFLRNEVLETFEIEETTRSEDGKKEIVSERIKFTEGLIVYLKRYTENPSHDKREHDLQHLERIGIRARKIEIENPQASTSTSWDWNQPGS
jgi:type VI secretion system Hcp family effector